jgi:hypothetical protein
MRPFVPQIVASLREDDTWTLDKHWATNDKLGVKVWTANGMLYAHLDWAASRRSYGGWGDEMRIRLSLREKFAIWQAYKELRKRKRHNVYDVVLETVIQRRLNGETT